MTTHPKPTRQPKDRARKIRRKRTIGWKRREAKAAGDLTPEQWTVICNAYGWLCAYCERAKATQMDHVRPIAKGGLHTASNVCPVCEKCQYAKGTSLKWEARLLPGHPYRLERR